jgi:hypothetical protein
MNPSISGYEWERITALGTAVIRDQACNLHVILPEVSVGTIALYDSATAAGTAAGNLVTTFTGGTAVQDCFPKVLDIQLKNGLTYTAYGTPVALLAVS